MKIHGVSLGTYHDQCPYLAGRTFTSENMMVTGIDEAGLNHLLFHGFRHFGPHFFRPVCEECHQCIPLRIPIASFEFSRNMRRVLKKAQDLQVNVSSPEPTEEKYRLYQAHLRRFSPQTDSVYESFKEAFFFGSPFGREMQFFQDGELLGVSHFDITDTLLSAVYCYWDPEKEAFGPGTLAILKELEFAIQRGLRYVYLGYYVPENPHMNYKARFRPNEMLREEGSWIPLYDRGNHLVHPGAPEEGFRPFTRIAQEDVTP